MRGRAARASKRCLDLVVSMVGLLVLSPVLILCAILAAWSTRERPWFCQERIGRHGRPFRVVKFRTMKSSGGSTVTVAGDPRITATGRVLRRLKLDELPQLVNVVQGSMSLVGPRPDVTGYADLLTGGDRIVLDVRPGITGPASMLLRDEEQILGRWEDPEPFNRSVLYPAKVELNRAYVQEWSFRLDLEILLRTLLPLKLQPKLRRERDNLIASMQEKGRLDVPLLDKDK